MRNFKSYTNYIEVMEEDPRPLRLRSRNCSPATALLQARAFCQELNISSCELHHGGFIFDVEKSMDKETYLGKLAEFTQWKDQQIEKEFQHQNQK